MNGCIKLNNVCNRNQYFPSEFSSIQWLYIVLVKIILYKMSRVLYVGFDVVKLDDVVPSSNSKRDPVQFFKQWPELFKSDRVL